MGPLQLLLLSITIYPDKSTMINKKRIFSSFNIITTCPFTNVNENKCLEIEELRRDILSTIWLFFHTKQF